MRKLLLASAAMLGATAGIASAQTTANPMQGQMAAPNFPGSVGNDSNNYVAQPSTYAGNKIGFAPIMVPQPGTVVVRLGGKVEADFMGFWTSGNTAQSGGGVAAGVKTGSAKLNPLAVAAYMRLYPGVDGMATNGIRYGAQVEIRENFPNPNVAPNLGVSQPGAAAATYSPGYSSATSPSGYSSAQTLFVRRAYSYIAADNVGLVRIGTTDGVIGLFDPCIFSGQCYDAGTGNFNGGNIQGTGPSAALAVPFAWLAQAGAEYGNAKIVYLSPQFFGFDVGVQYAPSMDNAFSNSTAGTPIQGTSCVQAGPACANTTTGTDPTRWFNQVAVGARYQGVFGPLGLGAYVVYETAGKEDFFGAPVSSGNGVTGNVYDNLSFVAAAFYLTYDTGVGTLTPAFDYIGGALNGQLTMRPTGGVSEQAFLPSLRYNNGPLALEVEAGLVNSQGAQQLTGISQRREFEFAAGGSYVMAPGLFLVGEYMYTYRHQGGFDFNAGAISAGTGTAGKAGWQAGYTRDAHGQGFLTSLVVAW
jgi:hypothetical protein